MQVDDRLRILSGPRPICEHLLENDLHYPIRLHTNFIVHGTYLTSLSQPI